MSLVALFIAVGLCAAYLLWEACNADLTQDG